MSLFIIPPSSETATVRCRKETRSNLRLSRARKDRRRLTSKKLDSNITKKNDGRFVDSDIWKQLIEKVDSVAIPVRQEAGKAPATQGDDE